jgi:lipopolysaccharide export system protein LptA
MAVHAVLVKSQTGRPSAKPDATKPEGTAKKVANNGTTGAADVIRVTSRELTYSDEARKAEFTGGVDVENGDGRLKAEQVVVYLQPAVGGIGKTVQANGGKANGTKRSLAPAADSSGFMGGKLEKMIASGRIEMEQSGRRATGEQLLYTASDEMYVLTGTATALPKVVDDQRGTVTGTLLRFHSSDDNVVVSNGGENGAGQRVRTETRVKNKQ